MNHISKVDYGNLILYVDKDLAYLFDNESMIESHYIGSPVIIDLKYLERDRLLEDLEKEELPIVFYKTDVGNTIYLKANEHITQITYSVIKDWLNTIEEPVFHVKTQVRADYTIIIMVLNILFIFGSLNRASSLLSTEINGQNMLILMKSGLMRYQIVFSKILCVFIMQLMIFIFFYLIALKLDLMDFSLMLIGFFPLLIFPSAIVGIFFVSVSNNETIRHFLPTIWWMPSLFYGFLKDEISTLWTFIIELNPLISTVELLGQILRNEVNKHTIVTLMVSSAFVLVLSLVLLKRTVIKSM